MDFKSEIGFLSDESLDGVLFLYVREPHHAVGIKYIGLTQEAVNIMRANYLRKIERLNKKGKSFEEFDAEENDPTTIHYLDLEKIPSDGLNIKELNNKSMEAIQQDHKVFKRDEIGRIKYILIRFRNAEGKTLGVFSKYDTKNYFKPDRVIKLLFQGDSLKPLAVKHDFGIDTGIELLFFDRRAYIFKKGRFLRAFNYIAAYETHADEVFDYLSKNADYKIKDMGHLKEEVLRKYGFEYYTKLNNMHANGYYKNVPFDKIKEIKRKHGLNLEINEATKKITFNDPAEFVRLYNRDYVIDDVGGDKWVSFKKKKSG